MYFLTSALTYWYKCGVYIHIGCKIRMIICILSHGIFMPTELCHVWWQLSIELFSWQKNECQVLYALQGLA